MYQVLVYVVLMFLLSACSSGDEGVLYQDPKLVVEGWIEDGDFPVVMVTQNFPVNKRYQSIDSLDNYVVKWAKVTVDDGETSVVLTGKRDNRYFPPYIYTTTRLRGKTGRKYTLTVEYKDFLATAITTIPSKPKACKYEIEKCADSDTLFSLKAILTDNPSEHNYYQFFTRTGTDTRQFLASYLGTVDDQLWDGKSAIPVYRGHQLSNDDYTPYFSLQEEIAVKCAQVDSISYQIWDSYVKTLSLSENMLFSTASDMETNIVGGYGYWCGFGSLTDYLVIK